LAVVPAGADERFWHVLGPFFSDLLSIIYYRQGSIFI